MRRIEFKKVSVNPMAFFDSPLDIARSTHFTTEQKLKLLLAWQYDARQIQLAEDEGMPSGADVGLEDVVTALGLLTRQSGTKHGT
jgi:hypothetical protein